MVETYPKRVAWVGNPLGLLFSPFAAISIVWGFYSLVSFFPSKGATFTSTSFTDTFPATIADIFFYVGMIWLGLYLAERIRILSSVRRYESTAAFCVIKPHLPEEKSVSDTKRGTRSSKDWVIEKGSGDELIAWAKAPNDMKQFAIRLLWSKIISESLADSSSRYLLRSQNDSNTDNLVRRVFELTHSIRFEKVRLGEESFTIE